MAACSPAFSPIIEAPQAPEIMEAKPSSPLRLIPRTSRQPSVVQESSRRCTTEQESRTLRDFSRPDGETRTRTGDTTIFSRVLYQLSYLASAEQG